jgi:protocatechuate 3,4-dioxygenase beta subunit
VQADGSFRIGGLQGGPFEVIAFATPEQDESAAAQGEKPAAARSARRAAKWSAKLEGVALGTESLTLRLQSGFALNGRVLDELGVPLKRFSLLALPADFDGNPGRAVGRVQSLVRTEDGTFNLEGLHEGAWALTISAKDFAPLKVDNVEVPARAQLGALTISRVAELRGTVLGPDGKPVARATVHLELAESADGRAGSDTQYDTEAEGRFEFKSAPAGGYTLSARHTDFARSAELTLLVAPGQTIEDLTLSLRRGSRLTGELRASGGERVSQRQIQLYAEGEDNDWRYVMSDSTGAFTVQGLAPGRWQVSAEPSEEQLKAAGLAEDDWEGRASLVRSAGVTIVEGRDAHVVLGGPPRAPVLVTGVVRRKAAGVAGALVRAFPDQRADGVSSSMKAASPAFPRRS